MIREQGVQSTTIKGTPFKGYVYRWIRDVNVRREFLLFIWQTRTKRAIAFAVAMYYVAGEGRKDEMAEREKSGQKVKEKKRKIKMRTRTEKGRSAVSTCRLVGRYIIRQTHAGGYRISEIRWFRRQLCLAPCLT